MNAFFPATGNHDLSMDFSHKFHAQQDKALAFCALLICKFLNGKDAKDCIDCGKFAVIKVYKSPVQKTSFDNFLEGKDPEIA